MPQSNTETQNFQIIGYNDNGINVLGDYARFPCVIFETKIHKDLLPNSFQQFNLNHLNSLKILEPEIIIFGTGQRQKFPENKLDDIDIALEFMDTGSACRVFNILNEEQRSVLAALF